MAPKQSVLDKDMVLSVAREVAETEQQPSRTKVANRLGMVSSTLNKILAREGWIEDVDAVLSRDYSYRPDPDGVSHDENGGATLTAPPKDCPWTREGLLKHFGFKVDEWKVTNARLNKWGDDEAPKWQLKLSVVPVGGLIKFPDPNDWTPPPKPNKKKVKKNAPRKVVICSDHHAPRIDRGLHACFLQWLRDENPDEGIINGDLGDFPSISRHRSREYRLSRKSMH